MAGTKTLATNRKARHEYFIEEISWRSERVFDNIRQITLCKPVRHLYKVVQSTHLIVYSLSCIDTFLADKVRIIF